MIDLRSDTLSMPDISMLETILSAPLGDDGRTGSDGRGEDATVNQLEDAAAALVGKEAAILMPTGTFGNSTAIMTWCHTEENVLVESEQHILLTEKCYYTDIEYYMYPFKYAKTCAFLNTPLYCYRLGREGQSMSDVGLKKHIDDHIKVLEDIIKFYYVDGAVSYGNKDIFIKERICTLIRACLNVVWKLDSEYDAERKMKKIDMILKQTYPYPIPYMGKEVWLIRNTKYLFFPLFWSFFHNKK